MRAGCAKAFAQFANIFCCVVNKSSLLSPINRKITIYFRERQILGVLNFVLVVRCRIQRVHFSLRFVSCINSRRSFYISWLIKVAYFLLVVRSGVSLRVEIGCRGCISMSGLLIIIRSGYSLVG